MSKKIKYIARCDTQVADLHIIFNGGSKIQLKLKKGEAIPVHLLDESDFEKYLIYCAMSRLISAGHILEVDEKEADIVS